MWTASFPSAHRLEDPLPPEHGLEPLPLDVRLAHDRRGWRDCLFGCGVSTSGTAERCLDPHRSPMHLQHWVQILLQMDRREGIRSR